MRHRPSPTFRPTLVSLEGRVVPAWWTVASPTPASGTLGDTVASHTGELTFRSDYTPDAAGKVTVWADSPTSAVVAALAGTITVTLGTEEPTDIAFGADTVGVIADHKAFAVRESGGVVSIAFEDMAGVDGCDYDYNDRSWGGVSVASTNNPVVATASWNWVAPKSGETAMVRMTVTRETETNFFWRYDLKNDNVSIRYPTSPGLFSFNIGGTASKLDTSTMYDVSTTMPGWERSIGSLAWSAHSLTGPYLAMGVTKSFTFRTPPVSVVAAIGVAGLAPTDFADGGTATPGGADPKGEAKGPGEVKVVITYADSTEVTDKDGLKVAKLEKAFYTVAPSDIFGSVVKPTAANQNRDFIDIDPDLFYVWVYDPAKWAKVDANGAPSEPRVQAGVTSLGQAVAGKPASITDDLTPVDLLRSDKAPGGQAGTGWYRSDSQILTSNTVDDKFTQERVLRSDDMPPGDLALGKVDGQYKVSDRTHKARLGDTVVAKYGVAAGAMTSSKEYKVPVRKYVKVIVYSLSQGNTPIISKKDADENMRRANEQMAQVGIKLVWTYQLIPGKVPKVDLFDKGLDTPDFAELGPGIVRYQPEFQALLDYSKYRTEATDDIEIYYVNTLYRRDVDKILPAFAIRKPIALRQPDANTVFIMTTKNGFVWPHEIGHILTNDTHYGGVMYQINLMRPIPNGIDAFGANKRFFKDQDDQIHKNQSGVLLDEPPGN